ncbi:uncharacterized protein [Gossypium hirsutum]|uniref:Uncharacterized protein n=1 Tax=Gossypium hirsutum TaxID=3635 RepID=A0ABM3BA65_GOSHI|nr:uncharacterized protein LOC121224551 [Gossypium hirsutum]
MVVTEDECCVHFDNGLRDNLRVLIASQRERDFSSLVEKVKIAEEEFPLRADQMQAQCTSTADLQRVVQPPPRGRGQARGGNGMGRGQRAPGRGAGQIKARQPALVYTTRRREDRDAPDVITDTFLIYDVLYTTFIDIGSTHSFVACSVSKNLGLSVESTFSEVTVLNLLGQSIRVSKLYRNVPLNVQGTVFLADLMELPFGEFDMILGMDWLVKHRVSWDYATKRVVLRTEEGSVVVVIGEHQNYLANMIFALVAEKLVRKGCEAYLAYVSASAFGDSTVMNFRIVRDFPDVFPEELPGLPSNQEVEFGIQLFPSLTPPEPGKEFTVYSDASYVGLGYVLM